jgi:hypothetical protein
MDNHDIYKGFDGWAGVQEEFKMTEPEPDEVLWAHYTYESYDGQAEVAYRRGDKYYIVEGGHCSCYGLEDQWDPEEYTFELFGAAMAKRYFGGNNDTR